MDCHGLFQIKASKRAQDARSQLRVKRRASHRSLGFKSVFFRGSICKFAFKSQHGLRDFLFVIIPGAGLAGCSRRIATVPEMAGSPILKIASDHNVFKEVAAKQELHFRVELYFRHIARIRHHGITARRNWSIHALALNQKFSFWLHSP